MDIGMRKTTFSSVLKFMGKRDTPHPPWHSSILAPKKSTLIREKKINERQELH